MLKAWTPAEILVEGGKPKKYKYILPQILTKYLK